MITTPPWRSLYPFSSHYLTVGEARMHYVDEGNGEPLLMVHGNPTWSFYWRRLIETFRKRYRVIAVDHIGCGLSDKPQRYPYTLRQHVENLSELVRRLGVNGTTLVAHDWGGAIGLGAVLAARDQFKSLVLLNTGAFPPPFVPWRIRLCRVPWLGTWMIRRWNLFARAALRMAVAHPERLTPAVRAGLLAPYDCWDHRIAIDRFVKDIPGSPRHPTWQCLERMEAELVQLADWPVQLIWGMKDWCFRPACLERLIRIFPDAEVHRLPSASHYVVEDAAEEVMARMSEFLTRTRPDTPSDQLYTDRG